MTRIAVACCLLTVLACPAPAATLSETGRMRLIGPLARDRDLSAVALVGDRLLVASDEGRELHVLDPGPEPDTWRERSPPRVLGEGSKEIDIEGLALEGRQVYVLGSHSSRRRRLRESRTRAENRRRLYRVEAEPSRGHVYRVGLRDGAPTGLVERIGLGGLLQADPLLGPFVGIPGKENGIDMEGIAASGGGKLLLGFRSPVLRGGWVPVMALSFDDPTKYELRFVDLEGRGIRDLARVRDGYLILAGPERGPDDFVLYLWDGTDRLAGSDAPAGRLELLGRIPEEPGAVPEGLAVMAEGDGFVDLLVIHDGVAGGAPRRLRLKR